MMHRILNKLGKMAHFFLLVFTCQKEKKKKSGNSRGYLPLYQVIRLVLSLPIVLFCAFPASALVKVDITQGVVDPISIAIMPFEADGRLDLASNTDPVIAKDLVNSGVFTTLDKGAFLENPNVETRPKFGNWRSIGADYLLLGKATQTDGSKYRVEYQLWDTYLESAVDKDVFQTEKAGIRRASHKIADRVFKRITGENGYFDTRVLFVVAEGDPRNRTKKLAIMDQDGANYKELTDGRFMALTPRFDMKSHRVIYMSYRNRVPKVFLLDLENGYQRLVGDFPGMTLAPRFAPDGDNAVMSMAHRGTTNIFEINLHTGVSKQLTHRGGVISTSPCYAPDGKQIVFASDRSGRNHLYVMDRDGQNVHRISKGIGSYNSPVWSPRGDYIAFTKIENRKFFIGVMRPDGSGERLLTSSWMDEGPTWSPNGRSIIFTRETKGGNSSLYAIDITGYHLRHIKTSKNASDPAWSPLLD
jgi:TolB protein